MKYFLILFIPGVLGGMVNAIAGGGGIIMYPALLSAGLSPIIANTTSSFIVWPGSLASAYGYRKDLRRVSRSFLWLLPPAIVGALIGSNILVNTDHSTFEKLAPWLVLSAVILVAIQSQIHGFVLKQLSKQRVSKHILMFVALGVVPVAIYGGYFGVGFGLMMLALLGFSGIKSVYQMNGVKNLTAATMAGVTSVYFWKMGLINWRAGLIMMSGTIVGGYLGARLSKRISEQLVHKLIVAIGLGIVVVLLVKG